MVLASFPRLWAFRLLLAVILFLGLWIIFEKLFPSLDKSPLQKQFAYPQKVSVEVYYEVLCPDSRYFVLHQLYPAWEKVSEIMDVHFKPYGKASYRKSPRDYTFECQHGPTECLGNMVHACGVKHVPDSKLQMKFIHCMIYDNYDPLAAGQKCAEELELDWAPIRDCATSLEGKELHAMHGDDTHSLRPKVSFIPTVLLNGAQDSQRSILKNFLLEVCRKIKGEHPPNCLEIL